MTDSEPVDAEELAAPFRSAANLTILSDAVTPRELAQMVGLVPDDSWRKGEPQSQRVRRTQAHDGISYKSQLPESATSNEHVTALLNRLAPHAVGIAATAAHGSVLDVTLWVIEHTEADMTDIVLGPDEMRALSKMGASLVASSYFYLEHEDG